MQSRCTGQVIALSKLGGPVFARNVGWPWTREEVEALTDTLDGATTVLELVQGNSWNIRIRKRPISLSTANR